MDGSTEAWLNDALAEYSAGFGEHAEMLDPRGELTSALARFGANPYAIEAWRLLDDDLSGMSQEMKRLMAFDVFWIVERAFTDRDGMEWASPDDAGLHGRAVLQAIDTLMRMDPHLCEQACAKGETGRAVEGYLASRGTWIPQVDSRGEYADLLCASLMGLRTDVGSWVQSNADQARQDHVSRQRLRMIGELHDLLNQHLGQSPSPVVAALVNATFPRLAPIDAAQVHILLGAVEPSANEANYSPYQDHA
ncbi:hypothetical protein [Pinirhizobacter sp.]|jgi:hypothetical protein|uniref:hypothetical protein n=1 Tax=Pinirhizobacter sp. TaxID=2950432 RepID=UPI002F403CC9